MRKLIIVFFGIAAILSACVSSSTDRSGPDSANAVKLGTARVVVELNMIRNLPMDSEYSPIVDTVFNGYKMYGVTNSVFSTDQDGIALTELTRDGNRFYGDVPVECIRQMGGIRLFDRDGTPAGGFQLPLSQQDSTILSFYYTDDRSLMIPESHNYMAITGIDLKIIQEIIDAGFLYNYPRAWVSDRSIYRNSWQEVRKIENDSLWPLYLEKSIYRCKVSDPFDFRGMGIPSRAKKWMMNDFKIAFAAREIIPYVDYAQEALGRKVPDPPMEAYSFLDSINFTPDEFLLTTVSLPQGELLKGILKIPGSGIEEIGETPVAKWQREVRQILAPAIKEPTKLLMDLLAGMSYVLQIDKGIPLSEEQISNIDKGFTDDIGKIVLSYNTDLARRAQEN